MKLKILNYLEHIIEMIKLLKYPSGKGKRNYFKFNVYNIALRYSGIIQLIYGKVVYQNLLIVYCLHLSTLNYLFIMI